MSGGEGEGAVQVFDATTTERVATIAINAKQVHWISASLSAKDPYVYYSAAKTDERHPEWYLGRIHIETLQDEGLVAKEYNDFALPPDGSILYARRTVSSPTGFDAWRIVNQPASSVLTDEEDELHARVQLEHIFDDHTTNPAYVPDPQGLLVATGGEIYSPTLNTQYGRCDFPIDCFLPNTPWVVGIDDDQLKATSLNQMSYDKSIHNLRYDMKSVGAVRLPKGFDLVPLNSKPTRGYPHNKETRRAMALERRRPAPVYYDAEVGRFLIASAERVAIVPLSALKLPEQPRLAVQLTDAPQLDTITPGTIKINTGDPRVKTKLISGPAGLTYQQGRLEWRPIDMPVVGRSEVILQRSFGDLVIKQPIELHIERASLTLQRLPKILKLSTDGTRAITAGEMPNPSRDNPRSHVTLIDVASLRVIAASIFDHHVVSVADNGDAVYIAIQKSSRTTSRKTYELLALNPETLSIDSRISVEGSNNAIGLIGKDALVFGSQLFSLPELKPAKEPAVYGLQSGIVRGRLNWRTADAWLWDGVVWDTHLKKARMLYDARGFLGVRSRNNEFQILTPWGPTWSHRGISNQGKRFLSQKNPLLVSGELPAALTVEISKERSKDRQKDYALHAYDLLTGKEVQKIALAGTASRRNRTSSPPPFDVQGSRVAVCIGTRFYTLETTLLDREQFPMPLHIDLQQDNITLSNRAKAPIVYQVSGGVPPYKVSVTVGNLPLQTVQTDRKAKLSINRKDLSEWALDQVTRNWLRNSGPSRNDPRQRVLDQMELIGPRFHRLVGHSPKGLPFAVPAVVDLEDSEGHAAKNEHFYLLEIPLAQVVRRLGGSDRNSQRVAKSRQTSRPGAKPKNDNSSQLKERRQRREEARALDQELAVAYSDALREAYPPANVDPSDFERRATEARDSIHQVLLKAMRSIKDRHSQQVRTWSDKRGHTTKALLRTAIGGQVVLRVASGSEVTVPIEKLSDADQQFLDSLKDDPTLGDGSAPKLQLAVLMECFRKHQHRTGQWPPAYLVDAEGKKLLSWRVALLADMGGEDFLKLMKLDEPWDSEHNRQLLTYLPLAYSTDVEAAKRGEATLLAASVEQAS